MCSQKQEIWKKKKKQRIKVIKRKKNIRRQKRKRRRNSKKYSDGNTIKFLNIYLHVCDNEQISYYSILCVRYNTVCSIPYRTLHSRSCHTVSRYTQTDRHTHSNKYINTQKTYSQKSNEIHEKTRCTG